MNLAFLSDMRRQLIDSDLSEPGNDGVARWTESVRYGGLLDCKLDGRQLRRVIEAKRQQQEAKRKAA